jgi:DNA-binding CsgD family transcriptional regulator
MRAEGDTGSSDLPTELASVLRRRVSRLPADERSLLLFAAAAAAPTLDLLDELADEATVAAALSNGLLEQDGRRVRFEHPLVASLLYEDARLRERRDVHRRLADLAPTREERALHRALATPDRDEEVAAQLDEAASFAAARGAPGEAARLFDKAALLTPEGDRASWRRRQEAAARQALVADDAVFAHALAEELLERSGPDEREALLVLWVDSAPTNVLRLQAIDAALGEVEDPLLRGDLHLRAAEAAELAGASTRSIDDALAARALALECGDPNLAARATAHAARIGLTVARRVLVTELDAAIRAEPQLDLTGHLLEQPSFARACTLVNEDSFDAALPILSRLREEAAETGAVLPHAVVLLQLVFLHGRAGRWDAAAAAAIQKQELSWQAGYNDPPPGAHLAQAYVAALRGDVDLAQQRGRSGVEVARQVGIVPVEIAALWCSGFAALAGGAAAEATTFLREATAVLHAHELVSLPIRPVEPDLAEALIALGELEAADIVIDLFERRLSPLELAWTEARTARARGSAAAARGELEEALVSTTRALSAHDRFADPFERARTLLVHGGSLRRAQQKRAARTTLLAALETFTRLGATLWTVRARGELDRIGGRAISTSDLTANERRVADLAAEGLTNREIAVELFLSVKTVEATLSRVYRKLGVRSRGAVARALAEQV